MFSVNVSDVVVVPSVAVTVKVCDVLVSKSSALARVTSPVAELIANLLSASVSEYVTVPSASLALEDKIIDPVLIVSSWLALAKLAESEKSTSLICKVKVCDSLLLPSLAVTVNECEVFVS